MVFCLQGFVIGSIGTMLGCSLAILFIRYREVIMAFIMKRIAGSDGQAGVTQFYDFFTVWTFLSLGIFQKSFGFYFLYLVLRFGFNRWLLPADDQTRPADALRSE